MRTTILALLTAILAACVSVAPKPSSTALAPADDSALVTAERIAHDLGGIWSNARQYSAASPTLKVPPSVDGDWLDLQHARFARVVAPALGDTVLYLEWRKANAGGDITRQRIWSFHQRDGELRMDFYAFVDGAPYAGRSNDPSAFETLNTTQLRGYGPACALRFMPTDTGWRGEITASECTLTAQSGRKMGIDARIERSGNALHYQESGRLETGAYAFRVPPTRPYVFERE